MSTASSAKAVVSGRAVPAVEREPGRDLNDFFYFASIVRHRGFSAASRATGVPKSRLSRRVRELEERLGARLVQRSTSRFEVTEIGQMFFARCEAALAEIEAAEGVAQFYTGEPRGLIRVAMPPGDCAEAVADMLPRFLADYPNVRVELLVSMRRVDLIAEQVDVAVRARSRLDTEQDLVIKRLLGLHAFLAASPAFTERVGEPSVIEELAGLPTIGTGSGIEAAEWALIDAGMVRRSVEHRPVVSSDDIQTQVRLCEAGIGIAMLPEVVVKSALTAGRLKRILPAYTSDSVTLHMAFPTRRGMLPSVRMFIDRASEALIEHFR